MSATGNGNGKPELPFVTVASRSEWFAWLEVNGEDAAGCWLLIAKKNTGVTTVSYPEAVDGALCFGWIDGQVGRVDEVYYKQRFTPRRARSKWSQINRVKVAELIAAGEMRPAGLRQVDAAKADGRWDAAYPSPSTATVPADLQAALDLDPEAAACFARLSGADRYALLYQLHDAKKPETRAARIEKFVAQSRQPR